MSYILSKTNTFTLYDVALQSVEVKLIGTDIEQMQGSDI